PKYPSPPFLTIANVPPSIAIAAVLVLLRQKLEVKSLEFSSRSPLSPSPLAESVIVESRIPLH
ncbi:MAG: hypothetical protein ACYT04_71985, partial [Nostoc sp.]